MSGIFICLIIIALAVFVIFYIIFGDIKPKSPCDKCNSENCCCCDKIDLFTVRTGPKPTSFVASEYINRIEAAIIEIQSQREAIDKIIVLWWGLDGLRLNDDGSIEWVSRRNQEPKNVYYVPAQYIDEPEPHYVAVSQADMFQSTRDQIEELQEKVDAFKMQNATHNVNAKVVAQMQLPHLQTVYPYGYIPLQQYPYSQYYQGNLTGCCCDGSIIGH